MSGLPEKLEAQRQPVVELAREHGASQIHYCDKLATFLVFAVEVEAGQESLHHVRLTGALAELLGEPAVVVEKASLTGKYGDRLREKAQRL